MNYFKEEDYTELYPGEAHSAPLPDASYECTAVEELLRLSAQGVGLRELYFTKEKKTEGELASVLGKCRIVADSKEELQALSRIAAARNTAGRLEAVGLRLIPAGYPGGQRSFREEELPELAGFAKTLPGISLRGCFVEGDLKGSSGEALAAYFHEAYQMVKRMTVILPCAMPYFCLCGIQRAVEENRRLYPETGELVRSAAETVGMQNRTAFYARLLFS